MASKPYSALKIAFKYARYCLTSKTHFSVHAPLVFGFCENVIANIRTPVYQSIELERKKFKTSKQILNFTDYGKNGTTISKKVSDIAKRSLKSPKYARLISRSVAYLNAKMVLELGTSLGITTAYVAQNKGVNVLSLEGDKSVAALAKQAWNNAGITTIEQVIGNFDETLLGVLQANRFDFIYIDGNHKLEPTLRYFEQCLANTKSTCVIVFVDIHYSREMEQAWQQIKNHPTIKCTIDLFFLGFVFINYKITPKHYVLRF